MDELARLRQFSPAPALSAATRAQAELALRGAFGGKRRRTFRPVVAIVAMILAAGIATAAYAVLQNVIAGSPAPPSVKDEVRMLAQVKGELIPKPHENPGIEVAKTKAAAAITTSAGPVYLWIVPYEQGDICNYTQVVANDFPDGRPNLSGGCEHPNGFSLGISRQTAKGHPLALLEGHIPQKGARTVDVRFASGKSQSYPVAERFVFAEVSPTDDVRKAVVRDATGNEIAERNYQSAASIIAASRKLGQIPAYDAMRTIMRLRVLGTDKFVVLKAGRATNGRPCHRMRLPFVQDLKGYASGGATIGDCTQPLGPTDLDIGPSQFGTAPGGLFLLDGPVGSSVHSLTLHFEDGTTVPIPIHEGFILYQVNPKNFASGHRPTELVARNAAGKVIKTRKFGFLP